MLPPINELFVQFTSSFWKANNPHIVVHLSFEFFRFIEIKPTIKLIGIIADTLWTSPPYHWNR